MSKPELSVEEQQALARKIFAAAYDRLWRRTASRRRFDGPLTVTMDEVRRAFEDTASSIGTRKFLPSSELRAADRAASKEQTS